MEYLDLWTVRKTVVEAAKTSLAGCREMTEKACTRAEKNHVRDNFRKETKEALQKIIEEQKY